MTALLRLEGVDVSYGPIAAVRGLSLEVGRDEVVALLGPNGAGKTSTLRAISGLEPHRGTITFDGSPVRAGAAGSLARAGLVHVPEGRRIFPTLSVQENLQVAMAARGRRDAVFTLDDVHDLFPVLADLRARRGWALSGGEQQMLAVARGLLGSPRLLLLDEPSLGLAPTIVDTLFDALDHLRNRVPMLVVEQNTDLALALADRAVVLSEGTAVLEGTASDLRGRTALVDSYLGQRDAHTRAPGDEPPGRDQRDG